MTTARGPITPTRPAAQSGVVQGFFPAGQPRFLQPAIAPGSRPICRSPLVSPVKPGMSSIHSPAVQGKTNPVQPAFRPGFPASPPQPVLPNSQRPGAVQPLGAAPPRSAQPILPGVARPGAVQPFTAGRPGLPQPILPQRPTPTTIQAQAANSFALPANFSFKPRGSGQPLPDSVQKKMESFFKTSFADVRIHVGHEASSIGALAFTNGADLYFAPGQYNPQSSQGQRLLGHELTHVVQQRAGRVRNPLGSGVAVVQDPALEAEAERMGMQAASAAVPIQAKPAATGSLVSPILGAVSRANQITANGVILPARSLALHSIQPRSGSVLQRYTGYGIDERGYSASVNAWARNYQRKSANRGIFQISEKKVCASDAIIETSEAALLSQRSFIQLVKGVRLSDGYSMVNVKCRVGVSSRDVDAYIRTNAKPEDERLAEQVDRLTRRIDLVQASLSDAELSRDQRESKQEVLKLMREELRLIHPGANEMFVTVRDCHRTARLIMGGFNSNMEERIVFNDTTGVITQRLEGSKDQYKSGASAAMAAVRFLKHSLPKFLDVYRVSENANDTIIAQLAGVASSWDYKRARAVYSLIQANPVAGPLFNRHFQVNDHAKVAVGQALAMVNDEDLVGLSRDDKYRDPETNEITSLWGFHWAGVVLVDGDDYVTLQAFANQDGSELTVDWIFKMYGAGDQSFHAEEKTHGFAGYPLTVAVGAYKPPAVKSSFVCDVGDCRVTAPSAFALKMHKKRDHGID